MHNTTVLNRQGRDIETQYRLAIFCHNEEQKKTANSSKENLQASKYKNKKIVTEIVPASHFYRAEEYHQRYFKKKQYVHSIIRSKFNK